jgi:hypothetical protein
MSRSYIIKNATVVSVDRNIGNVPNCDVLIEDGLTAAVGANLQHSSEHTVIDGTNAIISPGFIDTHRHTWQTQLRTLAADFVLADYILALRHIYGSCYSPQDAYLGNLCGALESINNGITYLVDHSHIMNSPAHDSRMPKFAQSSAMHFGETHLGKDPVLIKSMKKSRLSGGSRTPKELKKSISSRISRAICYDLALLQGSRIRHPSINFVPKLKQQGPWVRPSSRLISALGDMTQATA